MSMEIKRIPLKKLIPNEWNPNVLDGRKAKALARQIGDVGFRQPIIVRPAKKRGKFEIIDGEHRVRALDSIGREDAECIVVKDSDTEAKVQTLAMNVLRGDPDIVKMAKLIVDLQEEYTIPELEERLGISQRELTQMSQFSDAWEEEPLEDPVIEETALLELVVAFRDRGQYDAVVDMLNASGRDWDEALYRLAAKAGKKRGDGKRA